MKKITKQTLRISNLPKLFEDNWFEKTWDKVEPELEIYRTKRPLVKFENENSQHTYIQNALEEGDYIGAAYIINYASDIFNQSPMVYAMRFDDPSLLFALFLFRNDVNGQYYKDIDSDEWYSLLRVAYENDSKALFNLILLHPLLNLNTCEWTENEDSEISVFLGQGYQYDYFYPAFVLLDPKYSPILPYLNIDFDYEYDGEQTLFLLASEKQDFARMTELYKQGANILPESYDWGCPLSKAIAEYKRKGESKLLDWYADIYRPLLDKEPDVGGGLLQLMEPGISDDLREKFGLWAWPLNHIEPKFDESKVAKHLYRVFAPIMEPVFDNISRSNCFLIDDFEKYSDSGNDEAYPNGNSQFVRQKALQPVSIYSDFERIYKIAFNQEIEDIRIGVVGRSIEVYLNRKHWDEERFLIPEKESMYILGYESNKDFQYVDLANITEYQLMHLLINSQLDDILELHHYIKDNYDISIFCYESRDEYKYCRGVSGGKLPEERKRQEDNIELALEVLLP
ncbi:hypothetical protein [Vibrio parahaemolyticus]|uniref:hypothetical protein n=1 Tax=Vibrio parahaemolyticus TaxID=670 RepID=UPI00046E8FCB|nr:hypothetical protein [Vibrio parahaemolyticus]EHK0749311.1 hypothetical protein [Vibrio parahaemolyticus]EJE4176754.1 hypothetical protein [Vibrio parahaemolyticus]MCR9783160.1 hypothetical protein [Vibrio parahaemolyticus]MDF4652042.1 hypothetical protein [Vibrio parahaemolyticus]MDG3031721.1 hypothetical protein [Vibrio parahaemolyticus]